MTVHIHNTMLGLIYTVPTTKLHVRNLLPSSTGPRIGDMHIALADPKSKPTVSMIVHVIHDSLAELNLDNPV